MSARPFVKALMAALAFAAITGLSSSATAQEVPGQLTLNIPAEAEAGVEISLVARLTDPDGDPVSGAEIVFTADFEFLNVFDTVDLGRRTTGDDGTAVVHYDPRVEGDVIILAEFEGNRRLGAADASGTIHTTSAGQVYDELPPFRIPGANFWMAVAILSAVWLVFVSAMVIHGLGVYRNRGASSESPAAEGSDA